MHIEKHTFGVLPGGEEIAKYCLQNEQGMEVVLMNYGATVIALQTPDKYGEPGDVVLGFDNLEGYTGPHPYIGAMVGRVCNRISGARFELDGHLYRLTANEGNNQLHGGPGGFHRKVWTTEERIGRDQVEVAFSCESPDGEEGFPGHLRVQVAYTLSAGNELAIRCQAKTDKPTHVNLTNHSYFNLGSGKGDILGHELFLDAGFVTELNSESVPTGRILPVEGTAYDFRMAKPLGRDLGSVAPGYDINYVLNPDRRDSGPAAVLHDPESGRTMEVLTSLPGLQLYTSNYMEGISGKGGATYNRHCAVCLETQYHPDSCNQPAFPSTVLRPDEMYDETTIFRFHA